MASLNESSTMAERDKIETYLKETGNYEIGMTLKEMTEIYEAIKSSEESANDEKIYRESLNSSIKNEMEIAKLLSEKYINKGEDKLDSKKTEPFEDNNNIAEESFFPMHNNENGKDSDFSSDDEINTDSAATKTTENQSVIEKDNIKVISIYNNSTKNINAFFPIKETRDENSNVKSIIYKDADLPFYFQKDIKNLPIPYNVKAIIHYHETINKEYKKYKQRCSCKEIQLKPIPIQVSNKDKKSNKNNENNLQTPVAEIEETQQTSDKKLTQPESETRSSRRTKRKFYKEFDSDEDVCEKKPKDITRSANKYENPFKLKLDRDKGFDYDSIQDNIFDSLKETPVKGVNKEISKSTKLTSDCSDDEPSQQIEVFALIHSDTSTPKRSARKKLGLNGNEDGINNGHSYEKHEMGKGGLIETIPEESPQRKSSESMDFDKIEIVDDYSPPIITDVSEKFVPRRIVPPNPYRDKMNANKNVENSKKKRNVKKNLNISTKIENQQSKKLTEEKENNINDSMDEERIDIPVKKFYGEKISVGNRSLRSRQKFPVSDTECPICSKSFSSAEIQHHAEYCEGPMELKREERKEKAYCTRCEKHIEHDELKGHTCITTDKII